MKQYPQCMMCLYAMGRRCNLSGSVIPEEIYSNQTKCPSFKSISEGNQDTDDACCSETARFESEMKKFEQ